MAANNDQVINELKQLLIEYKFFDERGLNELISKNVSQDSQLQAICAAIESKEDVKRFIDIVRNSGFLATDDESEDRTDANKFCVAVNPYKTFSDWYNEMEDRHTVIEDIQVKVVSRPTMIDCYKMTSNPRGYCLIINNKKFAKHFYRRGSAADEQRLTKVFRQLGFEVKAHHNLSGDRIIQTMSDVSKDPELYKHDALVVIILSHGAENDKIFGSDEEFVTVDSILNYFNVHNCPQLTGKPKLFFVNACRGGKLDYGKQVTQMSEMAVDSLTFASLGNNRPRYSQTHKPTWSDFYVCHSTCKDYVSLRNKELGSFFGYEVAHGLAEWSHSTEFMKLMTQKVALRVEQRQSSVETDTNQWEAVKQAIETRALGSVKDLYFNPGI